jgi:hypothetical protein
MEDSTHNAPPRVCWGRLKDATDEMPVTIGTIWVWPQKSYIRSFQHRTPGARKSARLIDLDDLQRFVTCKTTGGTTTPPAPTSSSSTTT